MTLDEAIEYFRLLSKEDAEKAEELQAKQFINFCEVHRHKKNSTDHLQLAGWLRELKERRNAGWISCKERMPKPETMVIVACYGSDIVIPEDGETVEQCCERLKKERVRVTLGFIGSDGWYDSDYYPMMITPSFWQPIPEPPDGGANNA